jgi:hypothetical protein
MVIGDVRPWRTGRRRVTLDAVEQEVASMYTSLAWFGALVCVASVGLIFCVSGSIGIPVAAVGVVVVAIAVTGRRASGRGRHATT